MGFGSASLWMRRGADMAKDTASGSATAEGEMHEGIDPSLADISSALTGGESSVEASDQAAGKFVAVSVVIAENAWVAIHEDRGGQPGNVLGAQFFTAGENSGNVDLLRETAKGNVYYAMLHHDDGDHKFDMAKDVVMKDASGMPIMARFMAFPTGTQ